MKFLSNLCWLLFSFKGRMGWKGYIFGQVGTVGFVIICRLLQALSGNIPMPTLLILAGVLWIEYSLQAKRFHDVGENGGWSLIFLVTEHFLDNIYHPLRIAADIIFLILLVALPGTKGPNKYGDPYTTLFPPDPAPPEA